MTNTTKTRVGVAGAVTAVLAALGVIVVLVMTNRPQEAPLSDAVTSMSPDDLTAAANAQVFFGHQSVGGNVLSGIPTVYADTDVNPPQVIETRTAPNGSGGFIAHALIAENGDPQGKVRDFETLVRGSMGDAVQVALMKLCYVDITAGVDVDSLFAQYASTMADLEAEYPQVTFLHATVPLTTEGGLKSKVKSLLGRADYIPADNVARERYNQLVRERYGDTGRLWDIAAIQSTAPDGSRVTGTYEGATYYAMYGGYASDPGHLNSTGSAEAAAALLSLTAAHSND